MGHTSEETVYGITARPHPWQGGGLVLCSEMTFRASLNTFGISSFLHMSDDDYEFIKGEVVNALISNGVTGIPIAGFEIALRMGVTLQPYSGLSTRKLEVAREVSEDGFFVEAEGKECICYNDIDRTYERQNWTLLHELGHIVLDHIGRGEREEAEADFFAKYAIAPPPLIYLMHAGTSEAICLNFLISHEAARYSFEYYRKWYKKCMERGGYTEYETWRMLWYEQNQYRAQSRVLTPSWSSAEA